MKKQLYLILAILFLFVPLGLLTSFSAWGEWDNAYYKEFIGFIPKGIAQANTLNTPIPDYKLQGMGSIASYYFSAFLGIVILFCIYYVLLKGIKHEKSH